jgi:hypothetical protein
MRLAVLLALVTAVALLALARPANASISGAAITTSQPSYVGSCPATIKFTGTISGTAGTAFTYSFNRFVNSAQQIVTGGTMTMPASGSIAVNDSIPIASSTSGSNFDQIWVHNISGGQADVYSTKAAFSVTCGTPPPALPAPTNLNNTTSASTCGQHGGLAGLFCPDALHNGYLVLVWNYANPTSVDGYHVYETDNGQHVQVDDQKNDQVTVSFLKPPAQGFAGRCYVVTAYKSGVDSGPSNSYCGPSKYSLSPNSYMGRGSSQIMKLSSYHWDTRKNSYIFQIAGLSGLPENGEACGPLNQPCVGYSTYKTGDGPTLYHEIDTWRAYISPIWTGPTSLAGMNVYKATLALTVNQPNALHCFGGIGPALAAWQGNKDYVQGDFTYNEPFSLSGSLLTIDVTSIVRDWATGKVPNFGFVLDGSNETGSEPDNVTCTISFSAASLSVEHY